jgi:hypothetical protein
LKLVNCAPIMVPILGLPEVGFFARQVSCAAAGAIGRNGGVPLFPIVKSTDACVLQPTPRRASAASQFVRKLENTCGIKDVHGGAEPAKTVRRVHAGTQGRE